MSLFSAFICKVSLSCSAAHAKCPYHAVLHMQSVLIMQCCTCTVGMRAGSASCAAVRERSASLARTASTTCAGRPSSTPAHGPTPSCQLLLCPRLLEPISRGRPHIRPLTPHHQGSKRQQALRTSLELLAYIQRVLIIQCFVYKV